MPRPLNDRCPWVHRCTGYVEHQAAMLDNNAHQAIANTLEPEALVGLSIALPLDQWCTVLGGALGDIYHEATMLGTNAHEVIAEARGRGLTLKYLVEIPGGEPLDQRCARVGGCARNISGQVAMGVT